MECPAQGRSGKLDEATPSFPKSQRLVKCEIAFRANRLVLRRFSAASGGSQQPHGGLCMPEPFIVEWRMGAASDPRHPLKICCSALSRAAPPLLRDTDMFPRCAALGTFGWLRDRHCVGADRSIPCAWHRHQDPRWPAVCLSIRQGMLATAKIEEISALFSQPN